jgi:G3E family GTPase
VFGASRVCLHNIWQVKCDKRNGVDPDVIFGLDSKLFLDKTVSPSVEANLHDEVETVTLVRGTAVSDLEHAHTDSCGHAHSDLEHHLGDQPSSPLTPEQVASALASVSKESVWRIKGFLRLTTGDQIMNWAFGRYELTPYSASFNSELKLTVMGERGEGRLDAPPLWYVLNQPAVRKASRKLAAMLYADML